MSNIPFQGVFISMDESLGINKWHSGNFEEANQNNFARYTQGNQSSQHQGQRIQTEEVISKRFVTEASRSSFAQKFKKIKLNQIQTLKELRNQYQILKNIPVKDQLATKSRQNANKKSMSMYSSNRDQEGQSQSTSSKPSKLNYKKKQRQSQSLAKDNNLLSIQKRQLQILLGNNLRKLEQLLQNQIEYKKIIHRQQIQLDARNDDSEIQNLTKIIRKNESQFQQKLQNYKKQNEKLKSVNNQLLDKIDSLENDNYVKTQEDKKWRQQRKVLQNTIRNQKQRYLNLEIQIKKLQLEVDLLEKQKNSQINRLKSALNNQPPPTVNVQRDSNNKYFQQQLKQLRTKYQFILNQNQKYRKQLRQKPKQIVIKEKDTEQQMKIFQLLINRLRQEAVDQNRASIDLITSMVAKIDEKNQKNEKQKERHRQKSRAKSRQSKRSPQPQQNLDASHKILQEMYNLRNQVSMLKREKQDLSRSNPLINNLTESVNQYKYKIHKLQQQILDGSISKQNLLKQYQIMKASYNYTKDQYERLLQQNQKLKQRLNNTQTNNKQQERSRQKQFAQKQIQFEQTIRNLKRQLDQALFRLQKAKEQGQFKVNLFKSQNQSKIGLINEQINRLQGEKQILRGQLNKMKAFYQGKILEKNKLIQQTAQEFSSLCQSKQRALDAYKGNSERTINQLIIKIEGIASLNERYLLQSSQLANAEKQLHQLRYTVRKLKGMNDAVDHLWQIKQTQYVNVNQLLKGLL